MHILPPLVLFGCSRRNHPCKTRGTTVRLILLSSHRLAGWAAVRLGITGKKFVMLGWVQAPLLWSAVRMYGCRNMRDCRCELVTTVSSVRGFEFAFF